MQSSSHLARLSTEHIALMRFALPAAALDVFAIAILIGLIRQITGALRIDDDQPIAAIQKQLAELRVLRIRYIQGIFLIATLALDAPPDCCAQGLLGTGRLQIVRRRLPGCQLLVGLAIIPLAIWFSKKFSDHMGRSPFIQRLMKDLAGYNLNAATSFLVKLSQFEDESLAK